MADMPLVLNQLECNKKMKIPRDFRRVRIAGKPLFSDDKSGTFPAKVYRWQSITYIIWRMQPNLFELISEKGRQR